MQSLELLKEAMRLANEQRVDDALAMLERGISTARAQGKDRDCALLSRNAAIVCTHAGRLKEAVSHYEVAAALEPGDAYTQWALGDTYDAIGDRDRADAHWDAFGELARSSTNPELQELLEHHAIRMRDRKRTP
jgi:tetratricopeptide (TPR) repeat protein